MSLYSYLEKTYGSKPKKSKSKKNKQEEGSGRKSEVRAAIKVVDRSEGIRSQTALKGATLSEQSSNAVPKSLWKNLETNEVTTIENIQKPLKSGLNGETLSSGALAGLQTAEMVKRQVKEKDMEKRQNISSMSNKEVIYRDLSGRKIKNIDLKLKVDENEKNNKQLLDMQKLIDMNKGDVQLSMAKKSMTLEQLTSKSKQLEILQEDPAQQFGFSKDQDILDTYNNTSITGYKLYTKIFPDNRFGIQPGYRWDGVDRSNGFEKRWFKKKNELEEQKIQKYTMSDDM
ncbi:hypothetical protein TPHA_0H00500 [Tetrapisispora phaffii CBS 4417]|uniref:Pre-mRNA-splicing factor CWC26 n=1 Tax=Tetrapisispora phaffii (strain ATCC 24235 / CBS 4417 / NBRC 1672 / NRRL Y-8282 / UCD 70-5) TaxID=1071381 RepID=G8BWV6_TETPH|nr:hypothetical protein TPHA_0H00500 [Tetrapisispora phaffii CBS 4417]CCE64260.1 hypothetical protein TPHA_0H00500 [Tetrapisispora phaffii CBS 4417]